MIRLTRLSGAPFVLNCDLIERIDQTPDTVITLGDGTKYVAAEDIDTVVSAVRRHRAEIIAMSEIVQVTAPVAGARDTSGDGSYDRGYEDGYDAGLHPLDTAVAAGGEPALASVTDLAASGGRRGDR